MNEGWIYIICSVIHLAGRQYPGSQRLKIFGLIISISQHFQCRTRSPPSIKLSAVWIFKQREKLGVRFCTKSRDSPPVNSANDFLVKSIIFGFFLYHPFSCLRSDGCAAPFLKYHFRRSLILLLLCSLHLLVTSSIKIRRFWINIKQFVRQ